MTARRPTHLIYAVEKTANSEKGFWTPIGAAWQHEDADGLTLRFKLFPTANQDIVIRRAKERIDTTAAEVQDPPF